MKATAVDAAGGGGLSAAPGVGDVLPKRRLPVRLVTVYTATALLGTALFFFLHHLGNQIPYELAQQRFADEFEANRPEMERFMGVLAGRKDLGGDCQIASAIIAGAHRDATYRPLVDAVLMKNFRRSISPREFFCPELQAASFGLPLEKRVEKTRYWWGNKALSAIALRFLTVSELYRLILVAGFGAWLLLAAAVAPMGWRALLVSGPTIVFGMAFSDIAYFADLGQGIPYSWAVLAAAVLALLLRWPATARWAPWFCFVTGMTSSYLWFFDGHTALALVLIGLVAWLGYGRLGPNGETRRAAGCIALYVAGFVICFTLGQVTKAVVDEWSTGGSNYLDGRVAQLLFGKASVHWNRMVAEMTVMADTAEEGAGGPEQIRRHVLEKGCASCRHVKGWSNLPIAREFIDFLLMVRPYMVPAFVLSVFSVLALASAAAVAVRQARRGRWKLARNVLWLAALAALVLAQFLLPNDILFRESRFVFLVLAMCWTCLVLAMMQLDRRGSSILAGCLAGGLLAGVAAAKPVAGWWLDRTLATLRLRHVIQSDWDIYLDKDNHRLRLIYVKDECSGADVEPRFFLHFDPVDRNDLPEDRRRHGFGNLDFDFTRYGFSAGGRCVVIRSLPDYDVTAIRTGQYVPHEGVLWSASAVLVDDP